MPKDFLLVSEESKSSLAQACSQGLHVGKHPPLRIIVHFQNNFVVKTQLSIAPVFSCLFLSAGSHKAMQEIFLLCSKYAQRMTLPKSSYFNTAILTETQQRILHCIAKVPFGETRTYGDIAKETGTHPRTVGAVCKHNPFLLFFPCHRIIGSNGERHYCAGEHIQNILLQFEGSLR